jgi:hypothetical protein
MELFQLLGKPLNGFYLLSIIDIKLEIAGHTLFSHSPDELDSSRGRISKLQQCIHHCATCKGGTTPSSDEDDFIKLCEVRHRPVRTINRRLQDLAWVLQSMFMQIAGETIISSNNHLKRVCRNDGEGVRFSCPNAWNPEKAMSTGNSPNWGLTQNNSRPAMKKWCNCCSIAKAVYCKFNGSQDYICSPD